MSITHARLTRQGQITVPKPVRDALGLEAGDQLEFEVRDGQALVTPRHRHRVLEFAGIAAAAADRIPPTAEGIDRMIGGASAKVARKRADRAR